MTEREREAMILAFDALGACHVVEDGPNAGWVGGADGYFDDDDVCTPDCPVCVAGRALAEVLGRSWTSPFASSGVSPGRREKT